MTLGINHITLGIIRTKETRVELRVGGELVTLRIIRTEQRCVWIRDVDHRVATEEQGECGGKRPGAREADVKVGSPHRSD